MIKSPLLCSEKWRWPNNEIDDLRLIFLLLEAGIFRSNRRLSSLGLGFSLCFSILESGDNLKLLPIPRNTPNLSSFIRPSFGSPSKPNDSESIHKLILPSPGTAWTIHLEAVEHNPSDQSDEVLLAIFNQDSPKILRKEHRSSFGTD